MIRLNPTSIRLRQSDVKALQDELERRRELAKKAGNTAAPKNPAQHSARKDKDKDARSRSARTANANTSTSTSTNDNQNAPQPADQAVEERRRRRAAMSAQERIGYIC
ncbi:hypothetical protein CC85DRAFT_285414, partial [Cutaneotrichosporon oleaginosum]